MGIVYLVHDRERGRAVALKTLQRGDASALYRLKREFRALADIAHPNLVTLYELVSSEGEWFFTMELIDGVDFITWVRGQQAQIPLLEIAETETDVETEPQRPGLRHERLRGRDEPEAQRHDRAVPGRLGPSRPISFDRLRDALRQLVEGVQVLHEGGKLHRDIKPSNVMVDRSGRVVLLDFGLITDVARPGSGVSDGASLVGTVDYMSPEQSAALPVGPASDWYSVGTVLYCALTGTLPFQGPPVTVLLDKQSREPEPPRHLVPETPADLSQLCWELLRADPRVRPGGDEILARLDGHIGHLPALRRSREPRSPAVPLVGRGAHAAALRDAFDAAIRNERATIVLVHGRSGMGKTMLIEHVTRSLADEREAVVLAGRCHERESVPYKALDGLIDSLSRYLAHLPPKEVETLMPRDILAVAQLFPVLRRLPAVTAAPRRPATSDPHEIRRRGLIALRELLARVADRRPLVLAIDDFQWGDLDSTILLLDLLRPPDPPTLLLIVAYRNEEAEASEAVLRLLEGLRAPGPDGGNVRDLEVGALAPDEARELARTLGGRDDDTGALLADALARESRGDPFLIDQLVRFLHKGSSQAGDVSFTDVMRHQLAELAPEARHAFELIAVAGQPVREQVVASAAGLSEMDPVLAILRARSLVRSTGTREPGRIETYHDRIREAVVATLSHAQQRAYHLALGDAIEASDQPDAEALALHLLGGGAVERGIEYAIEAARKASTALAFERAIFFYRMAIDALPPAVVSHRRLRAALGDALVMAGRGAEAAASAYLTAAEEAHEGAVELNALAAGQLLRSGHVDASLEVMRRALEGLGLGLPETPRGAFVSLLSHRALVRLRGLRFKPRQESQIPERELARVDISCSLAVGFGFIDVIRGADFQAKHLLLALATGEPGRVARALSIEVGYRTMRGTRSNGAGEKVRSRVMELTQELGDPTPLVGLNFLIDGISDFCTGQWTTAEQSLRRAEEILRDQCSGVAWELASARVMGMWALWYLGRVKEIARRLPDVLREAQERGDLYAVTSSRVYFTPMELLARDLPHKALEEGEDALRHWSQRGFQFQHYFHLFASTQVLLYAGQAEAAYQRVVADWPALKRSLLLSVQQNRVEALHFRARAELALGEAGRDRKLVRRALARARAIERERTAWGDGLALLLRAGAEQTRGQEASAAVCLSRAVELLDKTGMQLYAAAARRGLGLLACDPALTQQGELAMLELGVTNPARMAAMLTPGVFSDASGRRALPESSAVAAESERAT